MKLIYQNNYGATFEIKNAPNPQCKLQLIVDSIGLFMTEADLENLLQLVEQSDQPCHCPECSGEQCKKLWCLSPFYEFGLTIDKENKSELLDLIKGTKFLLSMDETLNQYRIS